MQPIRYVLYPLIYALMLFHLLFVCRVCFFEYNLAEAVPVKSDLAVQYKDSTILF